MTTHTLERIEALKADVASFSRTLESFAQTLSPEEDNLMMSEIPENPKNTPITQKQHKLLVDLIHQKFSHKAERERWLTEIETMSKFDASETISSLLMGAR